MEEKVIDLWRQGYSIRFICKRIYGKITKENQNRIETVIFEWTMKLWKGEIKID